MRGQSSPPEVLPLSLFVAESSLPVVLEMFTRPAERAGNGSSTLTSDW